MKTKLFTPSQFTATEWSTSEDKALFASKLIDFILSDFPRTKFHKAFYIQLSMTFGHIAHFNLQGFYGEFFTDEEGKLRFLDSLRQGGGYGDPTYTFSDVEKVIKQWLHNNPSIGQRIRYDLDSRVEKEEKSELRRLRGKYGDIPEPVASIMAKDNLAQFKT